MGNFFLLKMFEGRHAARDNDKFVHGSRGIQGQNGPVKNGGGANKCPFLLVLFHHYITDKCGVQCVRKEKIVRGALGTARCRPSRACRVLQKYVVKNGQVRFSTLIV